MMLFIRELLRKALRGWQISPVRPWTVMMVLLCILVPMDSLALMGDMPQNAGMDEAPKAERKRRPRVSVGPVRSKRPGGQGETVFKGHIEALESYFRPLAGNVVSVSGGTLSSDLSPDSGVVPGMRSSVMRATAVFVHPVTGEKVTGTETQVGLAEFSGAGAGGAQLRLIEGEAIRGDIVRVTSAPVTVFFYQAPDVDWDVSEEYYYWLVGSQRFRVMDAEPGGEGQEELLKAARDAGAEVLITISSEAVPEGHGSVMALRQRALWALDGKEFYSSVIELDEEMLGKLKIAGEMFWPQKGKPVLEIDVPFRAVLFDAADLNCDGQDEMVLSTGTSLRAFALDIELRPPFGLEKPLEIRGEGNREHIWLEAADIDGDGCDEVVVSTVKDDHEARSYVYDYSGDKMSVLWKGDVFARILDGGLYVQDYDKTGGYRGVVRKLSRTAEGWSDDPRGETLRLPEGVNIYDFIFFDAGPDLRDLLAQDSTGNLVLYNGASGEKLWRSEDSYGGALRHFKKQSLASLAGEEPALWRVNDRMLSRGSQVFAIYKVPLSLKAPGLGFSVSGVVRLTNPGPETKEEAFVRGIPSAAVGMAISHERLYVLRDTYSVNLMNIFKGRKIFISRILIYPLEGM